MSQASDCPIPKNVLQLFKGGLREMQLDLRQALEKAENEIRALANSAPADEVDASVLNSAKEALFARNSENRTKLRKVELALERVQNGDFGVCVTCGVAIGLKRLQALPWTSNCIECQERSEQGRPNEFTTLQPSFG